MGREYPFGQPGWKATEAEVGNVWDLWGPGCFLPLWFCCFWFFLSILEALHVGEQAESSL